MNTAFIFPGQGSQTIGMGKDLYDNFSEAKEIFKIVNDAIEFDLTKIIFEGPIEALTLTSNTQPALMAVSIAFLEVIKKNKSKSIAELCKFVAGHSVGEYIATCAAGSIGISDVAKLLRIRGLAMQESSKAGSGMVASIGLSLDKLEEIILSANQDGICDLANDNTISQIVISGEEHALNHAMLKIQEMGGRAIKLNVSGAFHSRLMVNAEKMVEKKIGFFNFTKPLVPIILNVTAKSSSDINTIKSGLIKQISSKVRWREIIDFLAENNIENLVEIGSGKILTGMLRKLNHNFKLYNVGNIIELESFLIS